MNSKGLTLAELLISVLVASLAIGATMVCFSQIFYLTEISRDTTVAISDIRDMIEEIWNTPFDHIPNANRFPDGVIDGPADNNYSGVVGGYNLNNESIVVNYVDDTADPLEITVTTSWMDTRGRNRSILLSTLRTQ